MINFEKFRNELEILKNKNVAVVNGFPRDCDDTESCLECDFYRKDNSDCGFRLQNWLLRDDDDI